MTNQVYFSPECRRQLGVGEAELTDGLSEWEARLHPEDRERVTKVFGCIWRTPDRVTKRRTGCGTKTPLSLDAAAGRSDP
jgi:hypothetical protein